MTTARPPKGPDRRRHSESTPPANRRRPTYRIPTRTPGEGDFHSCGGTWTWNRRLRRRECSWCGEAAPTLELLARQGDEWIYVRAGDALRATR